MRKKYYLCKNMILQEKIHTCPELTDYVRKIGFLPLLNIGIPGWSADDVVDDEAAYHTLPEGGWEWPLWQWKGSVLRESGCAYGKMVRKKACFISREWWPDFCNYRRSRYPAPEEGSIEEAILYTLQKNGSMITRDLRRACGFTAPRQRSRFDGYVTRLQTACRIVTEDFVYPQDRHGNEYGWGLALLTTPERRFGKAACLPERTPEESLLRLRAHFRHILPDATEQDIRRILD